MSTRPYDLAREHELALQEYFDSNLKLEDISSDKLIQLRTLKEMRTLKSRSEKILEDFFRLRKSFSILLCISSERIKEDGIAKSYKDEYGRIMFNLKKISTSLAKQENMIKLLILKLKAVPYQDNQKRPIEHFLKKSEERVKYLTTYIEPEYIKTLQLNSFFNYLNEHETSINDLVKSLNEGKFNSDINSFKQRLWSEITNIMSENNIQYDNDETINRHIELSAKRKETTEQEKYSLFLKNAEKRIDEKYQRQYGGLLGDIRCGISKSKQNLVTLIINEQKSGYFAVVSQCTNSKNYPVSVKLIKDYNIDKNEETGVCTLTVEYTASLRNAKIFDDPKEIEIIKKALEETGKKKIVRVDADYLDTTGKGKDYCIKKEREIG